VIYIGIDPGKDGAMALICSDSIGLYTFDEQDYLKMLRSMSMLHDLGPAPEKIVCFLERVHSQPNNGVKAAFSFGENYGYIRGLLEAFNIPYQTVPPQTWKKEFSITSDKSSSIECAKRLFPNINLKKTDRCMKDHDGMAEALLIAEYCRRHAK
jgi:crossover junction endodeoxyribonuclease RuvC